MTRDKDMQHLVYIFKSNLFNKLEENIKAYIRFSYAPLVDCLTVIIKNDRIEDFTYTIYNVSIKIHFGADYEKEVKELLTVYRKYVLGYFFKSSI